MIFGSTFTSAGHFVDRWIQIVSHTEVESAAGVDSLGSHLNAVPVALKTGSWDLESWCLMSVVSSFSRSLNMGGDGPVSDGISPFHSQIAIFSVHAAYIPRSLSCAATFLFDGKSTDNNGGGRCAPSNSTEIRYGR